MARTIRTSARAVIWRGHQILVTRNKDDIGDRFVLPGGGQQPGEDLISACRRECLEEVSLEVEVGRLAFVREIIADNHQDTTMLPDGFHQVELIFICQVIGEHHEPSLGSEPDTPQTGIAWLTVEELGELRFFPQALVPHLARNGRSSIRAHENSVVYLGDVR